MTKPLVGKSTNYRYFILGAFTGVFANIAASWLWQAFGKPAEITIGQHAVGTLSFLILLVVYCKFFYKR